MKAISLSVAIAATWITAGCSYDRLVERGEPAELLVIRNVRVFPATGAPGRAVLEGRDVFVRDSRIERIEPTTADIPAGARILDGAGRTLLPGFVDCHVHVTGSSSPPWKPSLPDIDHNLEAYLYAGVTTILDLGGDAGTLRDLAEEIAAGNSLGPRLYYAGPILTARGGHPVALLDEILPWPVAPIVASRIALEIEDEDEAREAVEEVAETGARFIKIAHDDMPPGAPKLPAPVLAAAIEEAHGRGLRVLVHVQTMEDALEVARLGADALAHGIHRGEFEAGAVAELASFGIPVIPTLVVPQSFGALAAGRYSPSKLASEIEDPAILEALVEDAGREMWDVSPGFSRILGEFAAYRKEWGARVRTLHEAGLPILTGTDSPIFGLIPGASLHEELALLVESGLPPADVLLAATSRAARFLDPDAEFGTIEPGRVADLILVEGDPLADIRSTQRIVAVIQGGTVVDRFDPRGP